MPQLHHQKPNTKRWIGEQCPSYKINHKITEAKPMPEYRRAYVQGETYFLTLVNISHLCSALADVKAEIPFEIEGAVILPDYIHFLWTLSPDSCEFGYYTNPITFSRREFL
jgi:hypothetical protein